MTGRLLRRLRVLLRGDRFDAEVRKEIELHLEMETERRRAAGESAAEARRGARRDFGGVEAARQRVREARGLAFWDALVQDVRYGLRTLLRSPGYTLAAVVILALGIGANTAMFSVLDGVLLEPLPFRDGGELVLVQQRTVESGRQDAGVSIQELDDYRARLESVRDLVEYHSMSFTLLDGGEPDRVDTGVVSANFFDVLGVGPLHGRTFADGDDDLGTEPVLVLGHGYWQRQFGGDPEVVGRVLEMNDKPHTVVGVLPDFPQYPRDDDVYMPTSACPFRAAAEVDPSSHRSFSGLRVFGRLAPGAGVERASAEVAAIAESFERDHPQDYEAARSQGFTGRAVPLAEELVTDARSALYVLVGVTFLVLVIACANVANLALALRAAPGVRAAALTAAVPQSAIVPGNLPVTLEGFGDGVRRDFEVDRNFASDQYFDTLGVPLLAGRDFRATDTAEAPLVAIVNQSMAKLWAGADPVGRRFTAPGPDGPETFTVIGVAADFRLYPVEQENPAQFYRALSQTPRAGTRVLVRMDGGDPQQAVPLIREAVRRADPATPVEEIATIAEVRDAAQLAAPRLTAALLSVFALVALVVTLVGIAGVIGTTVSQRSRELGLRMALGASRRSVLWLVLRQGLALAAAGILLGAVGALMFSRLLSSFLFETPPTDPAALTAVAALFLLATAAAAAGPARRATTIDPLQALKVD